MPVVFQLTRKGDKQASFLNQIDACICQYLGEPMDDKLYCHWWYDIIGFKLATGSSFEQITEQLQELQSKHPEHNDEYATVIRINHFLHENYTSEAWREWGRVTDK